MVWKTEVNEWEFNEFIFQTLAFWILLMHLHVVNAHTFSFRESHGFAETRHVRCGYRELKPHRRHSLTQQWARNWHSFACVFKSGHCNDAMMMQSGNCNVRFLHQVATKIIQPGIEYVSCNHANPRFHKQTPSFHRWIFWTNNLGTHGSGKYQGGQWRVAKQNEGHKMNLRQNTTSGVELKMFEEPCFHILKLNVRVRFLEGFWAFIPRWLIWFVPTLLF